jgi:TRAP-type uncharacterized transport system substrate-binding protein
MSTQPLVRKVLWDDGTIRSAKDFRGRKIAINAPGDITEYFLTLMADKYGFSVQGHQRDAASLRGAACGVQERCDRRRFPA